MLPLWAVKMLICVFYLCEPLPNKITFETSLFCQWWRQSDEEVGAPIAEMRVWESAFLVSPAWLQRQTCYRCCTTWGIISGLIVVYWVTNSHVCSYPPQKSVHRWLKMAQHAHERMIHSCYHCFRPLERIVKIESFVVIIHRLNLLLVQTSVCWHSLNILTQKILAVPF